MLWFYQRNCLFHEIKASRSLLTVYHTKTGVSSRKWNRDFRRWSGSVTTLNNSWTISTGDLTPSTVWIVGPIDPNNIFLLKRVQNHQIPTLLRDLEGIIRVVSEFSQMNILLIKESLQTSDSTIMLSTIHHALSLLMVITRITSNHFGESWSLVWEKKTEWNLKNLMNW